jgi:TRAP-type C4-dicarboxylate transport system substrate-binding protein
VAGDESDVLRKIRIGQLQAAVLTSTGMNQIVPAVLSVSVPFLIGSDEELDFVLNEIRPGLEADFERNRLRVLSWSRAGWIRFFSREPVVYPDDLRAMRLLVDANDTQMEQAFKAMGYRPIPLPSSEVLTGLNSGLIDAFFTTPLAAAGFQWFGVAPNMLDMEVAPLLGAIVISDSAWRRIPSRYRGELLAAAQEIGLEIEQEVARLEEQAIVQMSGFGLSVQSATGEIEAAWALDLEQNRDDVLGVFDRQMVTRIEALLREFDQQ